MKNSRTLYILGLIMFVNALSYGTIVPLLYPYSARFGMSPFGLSMMFASYSLAQFIATPIIGRLSDRYGRKPLLLGCLLGTSMSLALFASAGSIAMLFIARIADGITGGNNSVAQAIVADSTTGADRAKGFGFLGASFGFGFLIGPALGGLIGQYGLTAPFWLASSLALIGTLLGLFVLKETLPVKNRKKVSKESLINFWALKEALLSPVSGLVLLISFISALALNAFIFGFQTFSHDALKLSTGQVGMLLALFGLVSIVMQVFGLKIILNRFKSKKKIILFSFMGSAVVLFATSFTPSLLLYAALLTVFGFFSAPQHPIITALLSERTNAEDQGGLLGVNQSFISLGQIIGPVAAGLAASTVSLGAAFGLAAILYIVGVMVSLKLHQPVTAKANI